MGAGVGVMVAVGTSAGVAVSRGVPVGSGKLVGVGVVVAIASHGPVTVSTDEGIGTSRESRAVSVSATWPDANVVDKGMVMPSRGLTRYVRVMGIPLVMGAVKDQRRRPVGGSVKAGGGSALSGT